MKKTGKCPKCGCADVIADAKAVDRGDESFEHDMKIATFGNPGALIFKQKKETSMSAWVCASCGFVELYADEPWRINT